MKNVSAQHPFPLKPRALRAEDYLRSFTRISRARSPSSFTATRRSRWIGSVSSRVTSPERKVSATRASILRGIALPPGSQIEIGALERPPVQALDVLEHVLDPAARDGREPGMEAIEHESVVGVGAVAEAERAGRLGRDGHAGGLVRKVAVDVRAA